MVPKLLLLFFFQFQDSIVHVLGQGVLWRVLISSVLVFDDEDFCILAERMGMPYPLLHIIDLMQSHLGLDDISWDVFATCSVEGAFATQAAQTLHRYRDASADG